ncbi:MAG: PAS domain-containing protein [Acidobacteria bacterium]|nr:PAS domain-containing protein [Acidobacteriota bacterium]MBA3888791.1 PAS domain-containing protein [Acidobacteriota bacterium]
MSHDPRGNTAADALRKSGEQPPDAHLAILLDEAPLGIYLVDASFRLAEVNKAARLVFGDIPDLIGRDFDDVLHRVWPRDVADAISRTFRHTLETGEPHHVPELAAVRRPIEASRSTTTGASPASSCLTAAMAWRATSVTSRDWSRRDRPSPSRKRVTAASSTR